ncbi:hypothetical protein ACOMHN_021639 [Nucella lapillus]
MVQQERGQSGSPESRDRKKRRRDHSPSDHSHQHRHVRGERDRHRHDDDRRDSSSPDSHRPRKHSHRHKDRREHREERGDRRNEPSRFDPQRRIKQEQTDDDRSRFKPPQPVKREPRDGFREQQRDRQHNDDRRREARRQRENEGDNFGLPSAEDQADSALETEKPNFKLSGKLTEDTRRIKQEQTDDDRSRFKPPQPVKREPRDCFREQQRDHQHNDDRRREARRQREQENERDNFGQPSAEDQAEKDKPNFELSGKLTEDTNTFRGVVVKYNQPSEARMPKRRWRLYGFKGNEALPMLPVHRQSAYLFGRDRRVADVPVDHPSCSKQHAVLQYRLSEYGRPDGSVGRRVRPYIIDLASANSTLVNNQPIDSQRYVELFECDIIKFGCSTREYVLLPENEGCML